MKCINNKTMQHCFSKLYHFFLFLGLSEYYTANSVYCEDFYSNYDIKSVYSLRYKIKKISVQIRLQKLIDLVTDLCLWSLKNFCTKKSEGNK